MMSPRAWGWTDNAGEIAAKRVMSPRAWGWTGLIKRERTWVDDVPTRVGVDRKRPSGRSITSGCPHARGGGPVDGWKGSDGKMMSPRAWGWTGRQSQRRLPSVDVPTRVGVDRPSAAAGLAVTSMSPRAWGQVTLWTYLPTKQT